MHSAIYSKTIYSKTPIILRFFCLCMLALYFTSCGEDHKKHKENLDSKQHKKANVETSNDKPGMRSNTPNETTTHKTTQSDVAKKPTSAKTLLPANKQQRNHPQNQNQNQNNGNLANAPTDLQKQETHKKPKCASYAGRIELPKYTETTKDNVSEVIFHDYHVTIKRYDTHFEFTTLKARSLHWFWYDENKSTTKATDIVYEFMPTAYANGDLSDLTNQEIITCLMMNPQSKRGLIIKRLPPKGWFAFSYTAKEIRGTAYFRPSDYRKKQN